MSIERIQVTIFPESYLTNNGKIYACRIEVEDSKMGRYSLQKIMHEDDFTSRFDWMMDCAKNEIKNKLAE